MRYLFLLCCLSLLIGCKTLQTTQNDDAALSPPSGLEAPAYDPSTGPQPVGQMPMPAPRQPAATPAQQPAAYGSAPIPEAAQTPLNPEQQVKGEAAPGTYSAPSVTTAPQTYSAPQAAAAPQTYSAPRGYSMPKTYSDAAAAPVLASPAAELAGKLTGRWVNGTDEREIVEFTPDHYATFYNGEMLLQEPLSIYTQCPGDCSGGVPSGISCFSVTGPAGKDCYGIVRMTEAVLELSLMGVSTETVTYYRQ